MDTELIQFITFSIFWDLLAKTTSTSSVATNILNELIPWLHISWDQSWPLQSEQLLDQTLSSWWWPHSWELSHCHQHNCLHPLPLHTADHLLQHWTLESYSMIIYRMAKIISAESPYNATLAPQARDSGENLNYMTLAPKARQARQSGEI